MKKKITGFLLLATLMLGIAVVPAGSVQANGNIGLTIVTGVVTDKSTPPKLVAGATVTVTCNGKTKTDITNATGAYIVTFAKTDCAMGKIVTVTAKKGAMSGTKTGTVNGITTKLNLAIVNVSIPEYGLAGSFLAAGAGVGAIAYTRRRYSQQGMNL